MAVADFLDKLEEGAKTTGRVAGAVGSSVGKSLADTLSGEAPQIHEEERQKADKFQEASLSARAQELESQLEAGRKYGTLTPQQQQEYVDAITKLYSHPSQMGTLVQKLHKAVHPEGAPYQPYTPPLASATPAGGELAQDELARQKAFEDEQRVRALYAKANYKAYRLADGSVVNVDVTKESPPDGAVPVNPASLTEHRQSKPVSSASHGGTILASFDPGSGKYYDPAGKEIADAKPVSGGAVSAQYAALYAKSLLAKSGKGPQLTPEEQAQLDGAKSAMTIGPISRAEAMARYGAMYNLVQTQDPATGADVWVPRMDVLNAARGGQPFMASRNSQKAMLAASALQQITTIRDILDEHPGLVGPIEGRENEIEQMGGIQSPDFARMMAASTYLAEHGSGVFGSRNIKTVEDLKSVITNPAFNADAFKATLDQAQLTYQMFLNPVAQAASPVKVQPVKPGSILPKNGAQSVQQLNDALQKAMNP